MYAETRLAVKRQEIHAPKATRTSRLLVSTVDIDTKTCVIMDESENYGPGLSSSAEFILPVLVDRMGLDWSACVFVDVYRSTELNLDPYYDELFLEAPEPLEMFGYGTLQKASFRETPYAPIGLEMAAKLRQRGYLVGNYLGRSGWFSLTGEEDLEEVEIGDYDGRRYYDVSGNPIPGWLMQVED